MEDKMKYYNDCYNDKPFKDLHHATMWYYIWGVVTGVSITVLMSLLGVV